MAKKNDAANLEIVQEFLTHTLDKNFLENPKQPPVIPLEITKTIESISTEGLNGFVRLLEKSYGKKAPNRGKNIPRSNLARHILNVLARRRNNLAQQMHRQGR